MGILAGIGGGAVQSNASKDIKNNQTQFVVGGLLSGAGQGALFRSHALGSVIPVLGTGLGAKLRVAIGGIKGWTDSVKRIRKKK